MAVLETGADVVGSWFLIIAIVNYIHVLARKFALK